MATTKIRRSANKIIVASGGTIEVQSGATLDVKSGANVKGITQAPASGTTGQYLKKTENGSEYAPLPQGEAVADAAGTAPTAAEFKALLDSLRAAGIIAIAAPEEEAAAQ